MGDWRLCFTIPSSVSDKDGNLGCVSKGDGLLKERRKQFLDMIGKPDSKVQKSFGTYKLEVGGRKGEVIEEECYDLLIFCVSDNDKKEYEKAWNQLVEPWEQERLLYTADEHKGKGEEAFFCNHPRLVQNKDFMAAMEAQGYQRGGCFGPFGQVSAVQVDGSIVKKRMDAVVAGDTLLTPTGQATVRCVVVSQCARGIAYFSRLNSIDENEDALELTEWHPVLDGCGVWCFPAMQGERVVRRCAEVYNLVLDTDHIVVVNGIGCVTLGHGFKGDVVNHDYYGTSRVIDDLRSQDGWANGRVVLVSKPPQPTTALLALTFASASSESIKVM